MSYPMFMLTPMTGREASASRTVIISGFEVGFRNFLISCIAALPALVLAILAWPFFGSGAILMFPITIGVALWLVQSRSNDGLKLRTYQAMLDKRKAAVNTFFICGVPVDLGEAQFSTIQLNTVPAAGTVRPLDVTDHRHASSRRVSEPTTGADLLLGTTKEREKARRDAKHRSEFTPIGRAEPRRRKSRV